MLIRIEIANFRSLAQVALNTGPLSVLFGPNGAGKSNFLDTLWFLRDCIKRGVDKASADRSHGIGALWAGADPGAMISISLETASTRYTVEIGFSSGRIEPFVGEKLYAKRSELCLIERLSGSDKADFYSPNIQQMATITLREPERLALTRYVDFASTSGEALEIDRLLQYIHLYKARDTDIYGLKKRGSEASYETWVWDRGQNLWSVLRNLKDRRGLDDRYDTIISFMKKSFPGDFMDVYIEQTGPTSVYGYLQEEGLDRPIQASGVSDGHLQMLMHLTGLFAEGRERSSIVIFDEPEISLHPLALAVFAEAVHSATQEWNKQVFIATHSPVLMSQFEPEVVFAVQRQANKATMLSRVSEIAGIQDLLEEYALGSLYMAEAVAPQSVD